MRASVILRHLTDHLLGGLLCLLLAVQVAFATQPSSPAADANTIQVVICTGDGLQTVTIDLTDGSVKTSHDSMGQAKCPFCLTGLADLAPVFVPPVRPARLGCRAAVVSAPQRMASHRPATATPIRAPPALL